MNINNAIQTNHGPGRRLQRIIEILSASGFSSVSALAETLGVSEMTIRRDLDKLETQNYIRRTHGGAVTESRNQIELDYKERKKHRQEEKERIGQIAAGFVKNKQSIFIDAGTTALAMVKHLKGTRGIRVITNSLPVQMELLDSNDIEVILIGGTVLKSTMSLVGPLAQESISKMRFDCAFLGTGGIDLQRGLTHSTMEEIPIKKAAAMSSAKVLVLADYSKFDYNALTVFMPLNKVDVIITGQASEGQANEIKSRNNKTRIIWEQE